ncbi:MAG: hypothetical protein LBT53_03980 [Puniceicoccales bacterium]|nr:hypothetical protein [Puniceicoccales bacterium]
MHILPYAELAVSVFPLKVARNPFCGVRRQSEARAPIPFSPPPPPRKPCPTFEIVRAPSADTVFVATVAAAAAAAPPKKTPVTEHGLSW